VPGAESRRVRADTSLILEAAIVVMVLAGCGRRSTPIPQELTGSAPVGGMVLVANHESDDASIIDVAARTFVRIPVGDDPHEAAVSPDGRRGVVSVRGAERLAVIDLAGRRVERMVDLRRYGHPHGVGFVPGMPDVVAVTSARSRSVLLVDITTGAVVATLPTGSAGTHMLGITADGRRMYAVSLGAGGITELDLGRRALVRAMPVAPETEALAVAPDGSTVWVGSNEKGTVSVVDTERWQIDTTIPPVGYPYRIGVSPDGTRAVVTDLRGGRILVYDVKTRALVGQVGGLGEPRGVRIAADNRTAFVTLIEEDVLAAIDIVDMRVLMRVPVGAYPDGVGWGPKP
jgi:YVTN family beta-propeller protein